MKNMKQDRILEIFFRGLRGEDISVQALANEGDARAIGLYERMGDYFGYTLLWFGCFYEIDKAIFLGRVASGKGGDVLLERARQIIKREGSSLEIVLPDEMQRRLGQSFTAASL